MYKFRFVIISENSFVSLLIIILLVNFYSKCNYLPIKLHPHRRMCVGRGTKEEVMDGIISVVFQLGFIKSHCCCF